MDFSEINWDINEAGTWPKPIKIWACISVFIIVMGLGYYLFTSEKVRQLNTEKQAVTDALNRYQQTWRIAQNFELYKKQYKQIQTSLAEMLKLMPTKAEMASLLVDISRTGVSSGLEIESFKPAEEVDRGGGVIELPIDIKVIGKYSELGSFISGLSILPRIVTIKNIQIVSTRNTPLLTMSALITTYREDDNQIGNDEFLLDHSTLACYQDEGLVEQGCEKKSKMASSYPRLAQRIKEKITNIRPIELQSISPMPEVEDFLFKPDGLRDPFNPLKAGVETEIQTVGRKGLDLNRRKESLEKYPLKVLKMVGTVKMNDVLWGMIKVDDVNDGGVYRVQEGNYLGENHGRILQILQNKIEIMESILGQDGRRNEEKLTYLLID